ncbi:hypothetical protein P154DRAFT_529979 [Amniculicola lignicola CBS 123094]|uniref:Uncharacterized protein n=1 Tax=Amniculicola lignicola CBS 123094 TaxID=1392246 RepID=A0A6A5WXJ6_9PLEO|nr:hypothetical protein P154DRAFT_529979 [Amniculicola lignicola CBS 123094]
MKDVRGVADKYPLVINLGIEGIGESDSGYLIKRASFYMGVLADPGRRIPQIKFSILEYPVLKHAYIVSSPTFLSFIECQLKGLTALELLNLEPEKRPPHYDEIIGHQMSPKEIPKTFQFPRTWKCHDKDVQRHLRALLEEKLNLGLLVRAVEVICVDSGSYELIRGDYVPTAILTTDPFATPKIY